jgi:hypothetical protein
VAKVIFAHVLPLTGSDFRTRLQPVAVAVVFIGAPPDAQDGADALAATFRLTPAETKVLASLLWRSNASVSGCGLLGRHWNGMRQMPPSPSAGPGARQAMRGPGKAGFAWVTSSIATRAITRSGAGAGAATARSSVALASSACQVCTCR